MLWITSEITEKSYQTGNTTPLMALEAEHYQNATKMIKLNSSSSRWNEIRPILLPPPPPSSLIFCSGIYKRNVSSVRLCRLTLQFVFSIGNPKAEISKWNQQEQTWSLMKTWRGRKSDQEGWEEEEEEEEEEDANLHKRRAMEQSSSSSSFSSSSPSSWSLNWGFHYRHSRGFFKTTLWFIFFVPSVAFLQRTEATCNLTRKYL